MKRDATAVRLMLRRSSPVPPPPLPPRVLALPATMLLLVMGFIWCRKVLSRGQVQHPMPQPSELTKSAAPTHVSLTSSMPLPRSPSFSLDATLLATKQVARVGDSAECVPCGSHVRAIAITPAPRPLPLGHRCSVASRETADDFQGDVHTLATTAMAGLLSQLSPTNPAELPEHGQSNQARVAIADYGADLPSSMRPKGVIRDSRSVLDYLDCCRENARLPVMRTTIQGVPALFDD